MTFKGLPLNFGFQSEARETILGHASQQLLSLEADLKRAESCFALKRQALAQLGDECMLLRRAFLEGTLATLYFRRAFDLDANAIDPLNDTMTIPVAETTAGPVPLRTYRSSKHSTPVNAHFLTVLRRDPVPHSITPYQSSLILRTSTRKILQPPGVV